MHVCVRSFVCICCVSVAMSSPVAIPFIQVDASNRFSVSPESIRLLSQVKSKLTIVVVAGPYRTGKSSLLNLLIGNKQTAKKQGFAVGGSINACTKGIWLWVFKCTYTHPNMQLYTSEG